jgi:gamma-glutamyltranspeptidase/glutathione hydrolase
MIRTLFLAAALVASPSVALAQASSVPAIANAAATGPQRATGTGVVSCADMRACAAGQAMLMAGGTAADAEMATMIALTVVEPQSSGIGGGGFFVYYDAARQQTITIDGREEAPAAATPARFLDANGRPRSVGDAIPGGLSVGVPGNIRLAAEVHRRYGRVSWAQLFAPAIRLADEGFEASGWLAAAVASNARYWDNFPEIRALYFIDGRPVRRGERVRNPALAALLREIASRGPDAFYRGATARAIVSAVRNAPRNPGDMTTADLTAYRAVPRDAVCTTYRQYRLCGMGPPSSGATTVFQMLGLLEGYDLRAMGPDNAMSWHLIAEAMRLSYADRDAYLGDPDNVSVPVAGLLDRNYLNARARLISPFGPAASYAPGAPPGAQRRTPAPSSEVPSTSHFVAVDTAGNVASMTSTVEGIFGSQLVARGMVLNNELTDFTFAPERNGAPVANRVEAGKRPRSSMSPTIVYDASGRPILALGSAGGPRIIMHVLKTLVGVLDFGMSPDQAMALPNIYMAGDGDIIENTPMGNAMVPQLARFGRPVIGSELGSKLNVAQRNADGSWTGYADPRSVGAVAVVP